MNKTDMAAVLNVEVDENIVENSVLPSSQLLRSMVCPPLSSTIGVQGAPLHADIENRAKRNT